MAVFVIAQFVIPQGRALACSCYIPTPEEAFEESSVVFAGRVIALDVATPETTSTLSPEELLGEGTVTRTHFLVTRVWKGDVQQYTTVEMLLLICGTWYSLNEEYLYYGNLDENQTLINSLCTGTKRLRDANADLAILGEGHLPQSASDFHPQWITLASAVFIILLLLAATITEAIRRTRSRS